MQPMDCGLKPIGFQNPTAALDAPDAATSWSRRGFVMTSLATGFAVASNPVPAQAIALEMFVRQSDVSNMTDIGAVLPAVVANVFDGQVNSELDAHWLWLRPAATATPTASGGGLVKSGSGSQIVVFLNVNHGFNADYRSTYATF